jgi:methionyl-tRNA formyltransferase
MRIDAGLDTGDILLQRATPIREDDTAETLAPRLAAMGADLMVETLREFQGGRLHPKPQDHAQATLAPMLRKEDGWIDFTRTAAENRNRLRGFQPWPGAYTRFHGKNLHVWAAQPVKENIAPAMLKVEGEHLVAGCGEATALQFLEVQPEGKKRMPARDFIHGYHPQSGERLG